MGSESFPLFCGAQERSTVAQLALEAVTRHFGRRVVFENLNAAVGVGETLVVAGANGSGKSTLLKIIAGLLSPSAGEVRWTLDGKLLDPDARRRALGYVAPDLTLYAELTGVENLLFFGRLRGLALAR